MSRKHYHAITIPVPLGTKARLKEKVAELGYSSMTALITDAVKQKLERERKSKRRQNQIKQVAKAFDESGLTVKQTVKYLKRYGKKTK